MQLDNASRKYTYVQAADLRLALLPRNRSEQGGAVGTGLLASIA